MARAPSSQDTWNKLAEPFSTPQCTAILLWAGASLGAGIPTVPDSVALRARERLWAMGDSGASARAVSVGNTDVFLLFDSK